MHPKQDLIGFGMHEVKKVCIPFATFSYLGCIVVAVALPQSYFYLILADRISKDQRQNKSLAKKLTKEINKGK